MDKKFVFTKKEKSWILYDWANSSYATIMIAAIFPVFFTSMVADGNGDVWLGIGGSIATGVSAIISPIFGSFGDYKGMKKKLFSIFLIIGLGFTLSCAFFLDWRLLLMGYIFSCIGFNGSLLFCDSMLTDVTTPERMNRVSAWAYSMGYIGGSTIPFVISILFITFGSLVGIDTILATKISIVICVLWWSVFSVPILRNVTQEYGKDIPEKNPISAAFRSLGECAVDIFKNRGIFLFVLAYFCYIDGVHTVIKMATAYGASLGLDSVGMILALLITQLVAFPCAILFGKFADKFGTLNIIIVAIGIYIFLCIVGFVMGFGIEENFLTHSQALSIFWFLAFMVGTVQGGIQALSRSYFGMLVPKERSNEYFGFFDVFGRFAAVSGPLMYAGVKALTGRSSLSILSIVILFVLGAVLLFATKKCLPKISQEIKS